jgi:hypothetical protein
MQAVLRSTVRIIARPVPLIFLLLVLPVVSGMSGKPATEIPVPDVEFSATVIDDQDIATKCTSVSWEGETFFKAMRGKGILTIAFEKVKKVVQIGVVRNGKTDFQITLRDGLVVAVTLDGEDRFFGTTSYGTYRIKGENIKEIVFE